MCRQDFIVPEGGGAGLPKNFFMMQTLELKKLFSAIAEETACEVCEKKASAVKLCTTCLQKMCEECCKSHEKNRTTRNHRLFSLRRSSEEPDELAKMMRSYCEEHNDRILEMYCSECAEIICLLCHALKHSGHNCVHVDEEASECREQTQQDISAVDSVVEAENKLIEVIDEQKEKLEQV